MTTPIAAEQPAQAPGVRLWLRLILTYLLIPLVLFACAGDLRWWQGWAFSALIFAAGILGRMFAERRHPGLLVERNSLDKVAQGKAWDQVLAPLMGVSISFPLVIVAGLDHRFGWSPSFAVWVNVLGLLLVALGYGLAVWALIENRFFSSVVRIQLDRGHVVCDSGPYRLIRHPGYAGNALPLPGLALALSSLWTLIPAAFALAVVLLRTALEDRTLQDELPGYRAYARRVRYRLIPWIY